MKCLTEAEFLGTFAAPMKQVERDQDPPCDFWNYFNVIPQVDFEGHDCSAGNVNHAWNNADNTFQHVLVNSEQLNVFMVVVIDLQASTVLGHRLLDLNQEYGLKVS